MKLKLDDKGSAVLQDGKPVYVHEDGKEVAIDVAATVAKITTLNGEAKSHRERAEAAEGKLKDFDGLDVTAARKALKDVSTWDEKQKASAGERDKAISEAVKAVEDKYSPIVKDRDTLKGQLETHLIGGAFSRSKYIADKFAATGPAGVEIAQALFSRNLKVEDGQVVVYDAKGEKLYSRAKPGELADVEEGIELLVDAYPHKAHILKGSGASGGGAGGSNGGKGGGQKTWTRSQFDAASQPERAAFAKDGGKVVDAAA